MEFNVALPLFKLGGENTEPWELGGINFQGVQLIAEGGGGWYGKERQKFVSDFAVDFITAVGSDGRFSPCNTSGSGFLF